MRNGQARVQPCVIRRAGRGRGTATSTQGKGTGAGQTHLRHMPPERTTPLGPAFRITKRHNIDMLLLCMTGSVGAFPGAVARWRRNRHAYGKKHPAQRRTANSTQSTKCRVWRGSQAGQHDQEPVIHKTPNLHNEEWLFQDIPVKILVP
jgi:hypothetical protein